jgi:FtsH-binding integral membrane protein
MINTINQFFTKIYIWMAFGVLLSAISAWATWNTGLIVILQNPILFYGIVAIEIGIALGMQWLINKLSTSFASTLYVIYAILNGITLSGILAYYLTQNANVVLVIFLVAASMFGFLAFLGFTTKKDLSGWRTFLMVGMWGVFFSSIVNIFLQNSLFDTILSAIALLVFAGLTVYDNQYYKNLFSHLNTEDEKNKSVIIGALHMYINFVMIFQNLLKLFGNNR